MGDLLLQVVLVVNLYLLMRDNTAVRDEPGRSGQVQGRGRDRRWGSNPSGGNGIDRQGANNAPEEGECGLQSTEWGCICEFSICC